MSDKPHYYGFRCDDQLSDLLENEPQGERSETIVRALREHYRRQCAVTCPTCNGAGHVYNPIRREAKDDGKFRQLKQKSVSAP